MTRDKDRHEFDWLRYFTPEFCVDGSRIEVLDTPRSFHAKLKAEAKRARKRIVLAALYLGTGKLEKELIQTVTETAKATNNEVKVNILLDYVRGSRGEENSKTMLNPLIEQFDGSNNLHIALYHTPKLRGVLKNFLPARWNEIVGIAHLKVFIFDDTFIISGANLSHDYFENRQDRYMVFHDCQQLSDYFNNLVHAVSKFSFVLLPDQNVKLASNWEHHPYDGNLQSFIEKAHNAVRALLLPANLSSSEHDPKDAASVGSCERKTGFFSRLYHSTLSMISKLHDAVLSVFGVKGPEVAEKVIEASDARLQEKKISQENMAEAPVSSSRTQKLSCEKLDTWVYPTVQMGLFGIRQDEVVTEQLMKSFPEGSTVSFTTGYFNVTDNYCELMVRNKANYKILLASPEANGFLGSQGFSGYIPSVYVHLCKMFYNKVFEFGREKDISLWEYIRAGWTFHGKGMWCHLPGETLPSMTLIGSPNFGLRSTNRDLEAQIVVVTENEKLRKLLLKEQKNLMKHSRRITKETFQQSRYKVPKWVAFVTFFIKRYF